MVGLTVLAVGTVFTAGAAAPVTAGAATGLVSVTAGGATATLVAGSAGAGLSVGAVTGAAVGGTATSAVVGAGAGAISAAGVSSASAGAAGLAGGGALAGPVGWFVLGASKTSNSSEYSWDCWKQVLRDASTEPSTGKLLRDIAQDPRMKTVMVSSDQQTGTIREIVFQNIWDESFRIDFVTLASNKLAAHAVRLTTQ